MEKLSTPKKTKKNRTKPSTGSDPHSENQIENGLSGDDYSHNDDASNTRLTAGCDSVRTTWKQWMNWLVNLLMK